MSPFPYTGGKCVTQFDPWKLLPTGLRAMVVVAPLAQIPMPATVLATFIHSCIRVQKVNVICRHDCETILVKALVHPGLWVASFI